MWKLFYLRGLENRRTRINHCPRSNSTSGAGQTKGFARANAKASKKPRGLQGAEREFAAFSGGGVSNVYH